MNEMEKTDANRNPDVRPGAVSGVFRNTTVFLGWAARLDAPVVGQRSPKPTVHVHGFYRVLHTTGVAADVFNPGAYCPSSPQINMFWL